MGAVGRGHVWSQAEPSAACAAIGLGGAAGQSRTDFLRQPRNQNHPVAATHSAVREVASVLYCRLASSASGCSADHVCLRTSPTGTVMWKGREDRAAVLTASMLSSHADRSLRLMRAAPETLLMWVKLNTTKRSLAKLLLLSFLLLSSLRCSNGAFCHLLQSWETITDDELTFNHSNSHSSHSSEFRAVCDEMRDVQISGATAGELHASPTVSHLLKCITRELSYHEIPRTLGMEK